MVLAVDKSDAQEHLSLICDFAKMLGIKDDEFEDIVQMVKAVCGESEPEYQCKSTETAWIFNVLLPQVTANNDEH